MEEILKSNLTQSTVYMDNAATSYPKPACVTAAMVDYMQNIGTSLHRGDYARAQSAELTAFELRERLCRLFNHPNIKNAVITSGATMSLNTVLFGTLNAGDHVLISQMEHNAVMRPLNELKTRGVGYDSIPCDECGRLDPNAIEPLIKPNTKMLVLCHASNVCGTVQPAEQVGQICKRHNILYVLDAAQSAGHIDIDFEALSLDALAVPAHKGLMGPSGIGTLLLSERLAKMIRPLIMGGTGSRSDLQVQPTLMPDKLESGTMNMPGIYGFNAALKYIEDVGIGTIFKKEQQLTQRLLDGLSSIEGVRLVGLPTLENRVGVISLDFMGKDNALAAQRLEDRGVLARCGLHCAPSAHKALKTFPQGTVRLSVGHYNTLEDVDSAIEAVKAVVYTPAQDNR